MSAVDGIRVTALTFAYGLQPLFDGLTFVVERGTVLGLLGRSGTGKTTLLNIISGLYRPGAGTVTINGTAVVTPGVIRGMVFQEESLLGWMNVEENILFPERPEASSRREMAQHLLKVVGLGDIAHAMPSTLSRGMQKRVEVVRALIADQEFLLADEPFGTLDALTRRDMWRMWKEIRRQVPRTGILSTHDPQEAVRLCDRVAALLPGMPTSLSHVITIPQHLRNESVDSVSSELRQLELEALELVGGGDSFHSRSA